MVEDPLVDCPVTAETQVQLGSYANAFRVRRDPSGEHVLDFLLYSEVEQVAKLVSRVRVHEGFVPQLQERLRAVLRDFTELCCSEVLTGLELEPRN